MKSIQETFVVHTLEAKAISPSDGRIISVYITLESQSKGKLHIVLKYEDTSHLRIGSKVNITLEIEDE